MQKIMLNLAAVAAVAGWVVAFLSMSESTGLEGRLAATKAKLTEASERLSDTQSRLALQQGAVGNLKDIDERMATRQAEALALAEEIEAKRRALGALRRALEAGTVELGALADRVATTKAVLSRLTQDQEGAKAELSRLRAESKRQREAVIVSPAETQAAVQAPVAPTTPLTALATPEAAPVAPTGPLTAPATIEATAAPPTAPATIEAAPEATTAAKTPVVNPLADAKRRFARIDQNGDGRFDRVDFRLKRVSLFGLVDANEDDYLTLDETLLSPEAFQNFDADGDGRISSLELADRRSFSVMDADGDEFITFEEYVNFLRVRPE